MMQQKHKEDYEEVLSLISKSKSLAISRFADGEASILKNVNVGNKDGWKYVKDKNLAFRSYLRRSLTLSDDNFIYGISSRNVDEKNYLFLKNFINQKIEFLTFSDIWVNNNYNDFQSNFHKVINDTKKKIVLLTGSKAKPQNLSKLITISESFLVPGNCVRYFEKNKDHFLGKLDLLSSSYTNTIFLIALGPLSNIAIKFLWQTNPLNIFLDIGSAYDPILFGRNSRNYHKEGHPDRKIIDLW